MIKITQQIGNMATRAFKAASGLDDPHSDLWIAVLVQAIRDTARHVPKKNPNNAIATRDDAWDFIRTPERHIPICEILNIEPEYYRKIAVKSAELLRDKTFN